MSSSTYFFLLCFLIKSLSATDFNVQLRRNEIQVFRSDLRDKRDIKFGLSEDDVFDPHNRDMVVLNLQDPNGCVLACFDKMFDSLPSESKVMVNLDDDPRYLRDFCNNIFPTLCVTRGCLNACPPSTIRSLFMELQLQNNLICQPLKINDRFDLVGTGTCYKRTKQDIVDRCGAACLNATMDKILPVMNHTVRVKPEVHRNSTEIKVSYESKNVTANTEMMRALCAYDACYMKCSERILRDECGLESAEFIENVKRGSTSIILKMLREVDAVGSYLPECQAMIMNSTELTAMQCSGKAGMRSGINALVIIVLMVLAVIFVNSF